MILGLLLLTAGGIVAFGVRIRVKFVKMSGFIDPEYIDGKFYRRPIHPGFITQRMPALKSRVAVSKGKLSEGLPTSREYRKR